jgi:uncharacterized membrane protein
MKRDSATATRTQAARVFWLFVGVSAVFASHVAIPFYFISFIRRYKLPHAIEAALAGIDLGLWLIVIPFLAAFAAYCFLLRRSAIAHLDQHESRLQRRCIAAVTALVSGYCQVFLWFNTFGT